MVPKPGGHSEGNLEALHRNPLHDPPTPRAASIPRAEQQVWSARLHSSRRELVILNHFNRALTNTPLLFGSKSTFETLPNSNPVILLRIAPTGLVPAQQSVKPRDCGGRGLTSPCSFAARECQQNDLKVRGRPRHSVVLPT